MDAWTPIAGHPVYQYMTTAPHNKKKCLEEERIYVLVVIVRWRPTWRGELLVPLAIWRTPNTTEWLEHFGWNEKGNILQPWPMGNGRWTLHRNDNGCCILSYLFFIAISLLFNYSVKHLRYRTYEPIFAMCVSMIPCHDVHVSSIYRMRINEFIKINIKFPTKWVDTIGVIRQCAAHRIYVYLCVAKLVLYAFVPKTTGIEKLS